MILLAVIVSGATLVISTFVSIWLSNFYNLRFPSLGTIRVIGVKAYGGDITSLPDGSQYIDWGTVYPRMPINRSFYIESESNMPVTIILLDITSANVTFQNSEGENIIDDLPIPKPIVLTSNFNNTILQPREKIYAIVTLTLSSDSEFLEFLIEKDVAKFNFEMVIIATEQ